MINQLAIVIGLEYPDTRNRLDGCYNDANLVEDTIKDIYKFKSNEIISIRDNENDKGIYHGSKDNILCQFNKALELNLDFLFIYVASHGIQTNDYNNDETQLVKKNNKKFMFFNKGNEKYDSAVLTSDKHGFNYILDDTIRNIFKKFSSRTSIMAIFDCCHSGTMCDVNYINILNKKNTRDLDDLTDKDINYLIRKTNKYEFIPTKYVQNELNANIIVLSAARDKQYSYELFKGGQTHGHFTYTLCNILKDVELEKVSLGEIIILTGMKINNRKQIPVLSSSKPIDVYNTYIINPPFAITHTTIAFYEQGNNDNPQKNKGILFALFNILSRDESEDLKPYFNIQDNNIKRQVLITGIPVLYITVVSILYYYKLV